MDWCHHPLCSLTRVVLKVYPPHTRSCRWMHPPFWEPKPSRLHVENVYINAWPIHEKGVQHENEPALRVFRQLFVGLANTMPLKMIQPMRLSDSCIPLLHFQWHLLATHSINLINIGAKRTTRANSTITDKDFMCDLRVYVIAWSNQQRGTWWCSPLV